MWFCDSLIIVIMGCCMYLLSVQGLLCFLFCVCACMIVHIARVCSFSVQVVGVSWFLGFVRIRVGYVIYVVHMLRWGYCFGCS
jgi:hypothetical protein